MSQTNLQVACLLHYMTILFFSIILFPYLLLVSPQATHQRLLWNFSSTILESRDCNKTPIINYLHKCYFFFFLLKSWVSFVSTARRAETGLYRCLCDSTPWEDEQRLLGRRLHHCVWMYIIPEKCSYLEKGKKNGRDYYHGFLTLLRLWNQDSYIVTARKTHLTESLHSP